MYLNRETTRFLPAFVVFFAFCIRFVSSEKDITINITPGTEECFFESLKNGQAMDIDYQVIDGGQGALDISFYLISPSGRTIVMDYKKPEKSHRVEIIEDGDYKFCFDNRFSSFNTKTVYFELIVETEDGNDVDMNDILDGNLTAEEQYEMTMQEIDEIVKKVKVHLAKIRHIQETIRNFAAIDKNILEGNFVIMNYWSIVQIIVMVIVGFVQVLMVKSLFDKDSKINKIWQRSFS